MTNMIGATDTVRNMMREEVAECVVAVYWNMVGSNVLKKAWQKTEYDWFPGLAHDNNNNDDGDDGDDNDDSYNSDITGKRMTMMTFLVAMTMMMMTMMR